MTDNDEPKPSPVRKRRRRTPAATPRGAITVNLIEVDEEADVEAAVAHYVAMAMEQDAVKRLLERLPAENDNDER